MRRRAFSFAFVLLFLLLALWTRFQPGETHYVFLHILESNNQAIAYLPRNEHPRAASFHPDHKALWVTEKPQMAPVMVLYEMDTLGLRLHSRLAPLSPDQCMPVSAPLSYLSPSGHEVIDNEQRYLRDDLTLREVSEEGRVVFEWRGETIVLLPGEGWSVGVLNDGGEPMLALPDSNWQTQLLAAWESGTAASRLSVVNYGLWPRQGLTVGEPQ